jgi:hypothetical protein
MESIQNDNEIYSRFMDDVFKIWINPEIEKRRQHKIIGNDFVLNKFQVLMKLGQGNEVRLNDEIKIVALVEVKEAVEKGQTIYMDEIKKVKECRLTQEDADAGHVTGLLLGGFWNISFNFQYNTAKRISVLKKASEFFMAADFSLEKKLFRAFHENMFSMMEALVMVCLISMPDEKLLTIKKHGEWKKRIKYWGELGNVDLEYTALFQDLCDRRNNARYSIEEFTMDYKQAQEMLATAKAFYDEMTADLPKIESAVG